MARLLLRDLTPGTNYKIQIRAVEGDSVSEWSRLFDLPTSSDTTAPAVPVWAAQAFVVNGDTFVATWLPLDFNVEDNKDFDHYEIEFGDGVSTTVIRTNNTSYTLTYEQNRILFGSPKATVTARVRSVDGVGNDSAWTALQTAANPAPGPVDSLSVTALYDSIDIKWADATVDDDFAAYVLQVSTTSASTGFATIYTGPDLNYTHATTMFNTDHWFRVYVRDKFGTLSTAVTSGAVRPKSTFQVDTTAPDVPTALAATITNNANGIGARAALTWNQAAPAANDLAGFNVRWRKVGDTNYSQTSFSHEDRAGIIELQAAFQNYEFQIRSFDWMGNYSAWTATVTATSPTNTAPGQTTGLAAVAGRDSIRYTWTPSTADDLKEYEVTFSTSSTFASGNITFKTGNAAYLDIGGLTAGTTYYARVRAIDNAGAAGAFSATNTTTTLAQLTPGDIGAPTNDQFNTAIKSYVTEYAVNNSESTAPTSGWSTATPTRTPGSFIWVRTVVTKQDNSTSTTNPALLTGNTGAQGSQGIQGPAGSDGTSLYTWLKYADTPTSGMSDDPTGKTYMGVAYNKTSATESTNYADYQWSLIKGADGSDGAQGIQGPPGADGQTTYTWVKYATDANGSGMSDSPTGKTYIGLAFNKTTATESTTATDYQWSLIQGPKGDTGSQGIPGTPGADGVTYYTWVKYADTPTTGMSDDPAGKVYMGIAYNKTSSTESTNYADYSWSLIKGADGAAGPAGKGISSTVVDYAKNTSGTANPTTGWGTSIPATVAGEFLWTRTETTYTDNSKTTAYSVAAHGATGNTGGTGPAGRGVSSTAVTYAKSTSGTTPPASANFGTSIPATTAGEFLWTRTITNYTDGLNPTTAYSVAAHGATGQQGIQGPPGADGQPTYTWIKYATDANGANMADDPAGKTYIGLAYNKSTATESTVATDYQWALIQGPQGPAGTNGTNGSNGVSVTGVKPWFARVNTGTTPTQPANGTATPASPWQDTEPAWAAGTELWRTEAVSYSSGTSPVYTAQTKVATYGAITTAITAANGKNQVIFSTGDATGTADASGVAYIDGDIWYKRDANGVVIATWEYVTGTGGGWKSRTFGDATLNSLNVGKLVSGDITSALIKIASTGAIQSTDYAAGSLGWRLNATGLEINKGSVKASALIGDTLGSSTGTIQIAAGANIVMNGGYIKSNTNTGTTMATAETSGAGFYLGNDGLFIGTGGKVKANALISDTLTSTIITLGTGGEIKGGSWTLNSSGLTIPDGAIAASKLVLQQGQNIVPPVYSDFEGNPLLYKTFPANPMTAVTVAQGNVICDARSDVPAKFGTQHFTTFMGNTNTVSPVVYLGRSTTDYNIPVEAGKSYIFSAYGWCLGSVATNLQLKVKWSTGTVSTLTVGSGQVANATLAANGTAATATRLSGYATAPAGATGAVVVLESSTLSANAGFSVDGVQVEARNTSAFLPSPWSPGTSTTINGGQIVTGRIQSTADAVDANGAVISDLKAWSIDPAGSAQFGNVLIRGTMIMGVSGTEPVVDLDNPTAEDLTGVSIMKSYNYEPGLSGWAIKSNGNAEFLQLAANSISGAAISAISPDKLSPGIMSADIVVGASIRSVEQERLYVTHKSRTNNVATLTTSAPHTRLIGDRIQVRLDQEVAADTSFDTPGFTFATVTAVTSNTISYVNNGSDVATTAHGGTSYIFVEGRSVQMDPTGVTLLNNDGVSPVVQLPTDPREPAFFAGNVQANSLTVIDDFLLQGPENYIASGSTLTLNASVVPPSSTPSATASWDNINTAFDDSYSAWKAGLFYEAGANRYLVTNSFFGGSVQAFNPDGSYNFNLSVKKEGNIYGIVKIAGYYYTLQAIGNELSDERVKWKVIRYNNTGTGLDSILSEWEYNEASNSHFNVTYNEWIINGWSGSALKEPAIGTDGTNIYLARPNKAGVIVITTHTPTTGARTASVKTNITDNQNLKSINGGNFDYGSFRYVITTGGTSASPARNYVTNSAGTHQTTETFLSPNSTKLWGTAWNGSQFVSLGQNNRAYWYSAVSKSGNATYYVKSSWYDGDNTRTVNISGRSGNGTTTTLTLPTGHGFQINDTVYVSGTGAGTTLDGNHYTVTSVTTTSIAFAGAYSGSGGAGGQVTNEWETGLGGYSTINVTRRANLILATTAVPQGAGSNIPDRPRFYVSTSATGTYYRQANPPAGNQQKFISDPVLSGSTTTGAPFPAGANPAKIISNNGLLEISSDGFVRTDRLVLQSTRDASTASGNTPALMIGTTTSTHLRIDNNEIIAMSSDTAQGILSMNPGGRTNFTDVSVNGNFTAAIRTGFDIRTNVVGTGGGLFDEAYATAGTTTAQVNQNGRVVKSSSSRRYKENIEPMSLELAKTVMDIEPVTYEWIDKETNGYGRFPGVIAEQAHEVGATPWVNYRNDLDEDGNLVPDGFRYGEVTAAHNLLIKELYKEIESLKEQVAALTPMRGE